MGKVIDGGWVPEDDPMFNGTTMVFTVRRPEQSIESGDGVPASRGVKLREDK